MSKSTQAGWVVFLAVALLASAFDATAETRTWVGGSNGDWFDSTKWSPNTSYPVAGDSVTIASGSVLLTNSTAILDSFIITNATMTFSNVTTTLNATNVTINNNGRLAHVVCVTNGAVTFTNRIVVICTNLTVNTGGLIDANASGYTGRYANAGTGPGAGYAPPGGGVYGSGGGYGGVGGYGMYVNWLGGAIYGSASEPVDPGSSGGTGSGTGGNGGGAIWISADGAVIVNGTIRANGGNGNGDQAAAGSGGGVYIKCLTLQGSGFVQANGGNLGGNGGGGGGGRIAVAYDPAAQAQVSPQSAVLFTTLGGSANALARYGLPGSLHFPDTAILTAFLPHTGVLTMPGSTAWMPDSLNVSTGKLTFPSGFQLGVTNNLVIMSNAVLTLTEVTGLAVGNNLILTNNGTLVIRSVSTNGTPYGCLLGVTGDIVIASGSILYPYSQTNNGGSVKIVANNVTVLPGGQINGDGGGFVTGTNQNSKGYGPGGGFGSVSGGGGGYGGVGGRGNPGHGANYGGTNYGFAAEPYLFAGSAGGRGNGPGGSGGSLIWIAATNKVTIGGTLTANGNVGGSMGGGGSGGGIYIDCPVLGSTTSGVIRANGGNGGGESGGGGGGRVALSTWMTNQYDGTITVTKGLNSGSGSTDGSNGTIYVVRNSGLSATLTVKGSPVRHEISTPFDYGAYALNTGTTVTNEIPQVAETITGVSRFYLLNWSVTNGAGTLLAGDITTQAVFTVNEDVTMTWKWTNQWYLTATADLHGGILADPTGWYTNADIVSVTATADTGYAFSAWTGTGVPVGQNAINPLSLTMGQARTINATFVDTTPQTRTWSGATNTWLTAANWSPIGIPGPSDTLTIQSGVVYLTDPANALSLTINGGASLVFTNWPTMLTISNDLTVLSNGVITHAASNTNGAPANTNRVNIICGNLVVNLGGLIDVDGKGYGPGSSANGQGPGGGSWNTSGAGGGYGGAGGSGNPGHGNVGGPAYGSDSAPFELGSGGAVASGNTGGQGGGAVRIQASGAVTVNGVIRARGIAPGGANSGGGSGGSIWITSDTLVGSGAIQADGGTYSGEGGSGGGGRIAVSYNPASQASVSPQATVRFGVGRTVNQYGVYSQQGTVYLPNSVLFPDQIVNLFTTDTRVYGVTAWSPTALLVTNREIAFEEPGFALTAASVTVMGSGSALQLTNATATCSGELLLTNGGAFRMYRGANSAESLSIGGNATLNNGTLLFQYPLSNPTALTITGSLLLTNGAATHLYSGLTNGVSLNYGALFDFSSKNMVITTNCSVYVYSHPTNGGSMKMLVNNLTISAGGQINANNNGFSSGTLAHRNGFGPGFGYNGANSGGGGGYGGAGGMGGHGDSYQGVTYGSSNMPIQAGSGGGDYRGFPTGFGGGLVWIEAGGKIILDGAIRANGGSASGYQGAGSGGGVYIKCRSFAGGVSGVLTANGGNGGAESGGGGGGRIAVWRVSHVGTPGTVTANPGSSPYAPVAVVGTIVFGQLPVAGTLILIR